MTGPVQPFSQTAAAVAATAEEADARDLRAQLGELITCASWRLRRGSAKELAPLGLTFGQARALRVLARADAPARMGDVAARLEIAPRSATSMIDGLEKAALVARRADPDDRRSVLVELTADGAALLERMSRARRASARALFGRLTPDEQHELARLLARLCEEACA
jgi:DNA-binding MarR family transcriptional regulator